MHNRYNRIALFAALALVATGCNSVAPDAPTLLAPTSARLTEAGGGGDLAVSLQGLRKFKNETLATFRADVSGGVPPYYYYWTEQVCWYPGNSCSDYSITEGADKGSIKHLIRSDFQTVRLQVQVKDSQDEYITGSHAVDIFAPGFYKMGVGGNFNCGGKSFPFTEWHSGDSHLGQMYDRSNCDGHKIYQSGFPDWQ